ncbi:unnamed protein product [Tilletia caries]|nr:unnamed protein product [Tilletia caries]
MSLAVPSHPRGAAAQVWAISELAIEIMSYLVRERIDLVTLSTVSKQLRALALPLLVHDLDVSLTKVPSYVTFLKANPGLVDNIKHLRVWDDNLTYGACHQVDDDFERHAIFTEEDEEQVEEECQWMEAEEENLAGEAGRWCRAAPLFETISTNRTKALMPAIDVSAGATTMAGFTGLLEDHDEVLERIVALRVSANDPERRSGYEHDEIWQEYVQTIYASRWRHFADTMTKMCGSESEAALRLFQLEDHGDVQMSRRDIMEYVWSSIQTGLLRTVEDLSLRLWMCMHHNDRMTVVLRATWPQLRSLRLVATAGIVLHWTVIQQVLDDFLTRHPLLERIHISNCDFVSPAPIPQYFPNLKVCSIEKTSTKHLGAFLARHFETIRDLTVPVCRDYDVEAILPDPNVVPKLDILRASPLVAAKFVRRGAKIRHFQFDKVPNFQELNLHDWLFPIPEAADAVTCLDIEFEEPSIMEVVEELSSALPAAAFPNLTELALRHCRDEPLSIAEMDRMEWEEEQTRDPTTMLTDLFAAMKDHKSLRALRVAYPHAKPLPPDTVLDLDDGDMMPSRLEYLSWQLDDVKRERTQYFRLVTVDRPCLPSADSSEGTTTSGVGIRLDRLPASFACRIDGRGAWHYPERMVREDRTLFDHSCHPPRLLV